MQVRERPAARHEIRFNVKTGAEQEVHRACVKELKVFTKKFGQGRDTTTGKKAATS